MAERQVLAAPRQAAAEPAPAGRGLAVWLLVGGSVGLLAAFVLAVEKYAVLANPDHVPSCSINPVLSCGSIMASRQAEAFGFPNPLLGIAGFAVVAATGAALLAGARLAGWFWAGLQVGVTAAVLFVHWLVFASLYRIGALCPYCTVVWAVTIPLFTAVTLRNSTAWAPHLPAGVNAAVAALRARHSVLLTAWFLVIAAAITQRFWLYWTTLVG
ncbi:vitamin K epoxide reductase family protein [Modestobacter sp. VKM Ac-2983]|uniref:vitamin K epoxide reductase family protein n=1 Tax=Modestobacter sp. VKM Ac-2983 TaxID=3004137 RepID=UPI0022AB76AD|nr:vitamin K epoxide reductase family protein [Modestobacter sp. VKM Ac-2983]MCZ2806958.1 vitamin K epoxide reductase family protein [Modestobacter sp. VKM Ac-2983]